MSLFPTERSKLKVSSSICWKLINIKFFSSSYQRFASEIELRRGQWKCRKLMSKSRHCWHSRICTQPSCRFHQHWSFNGTTQYSVTINVHIILCNFKFKSIYNYQNLHFLYIPQFNPILRIMFQENIINMEIYYLK